MKRTVQFKWGAYQSRVHILPYPRYYLSVNPSSYAPSISITATLSKQSEARDISRGGPSSKQKSRNSPASFTSVRATRKMVWQCVACPLCGLQHKTLKTLSQHCKNAPNGHPSVVKAQCKKTPTNNLMKSYSTKKSNINIANMQNKYR